MLLRFIVKTHIATGYGCIQCTACIAHSSDGFSELPIDLRIIWIPKVEAIRNRNGFCSHTSHITSGFRDSHHAAFIGIKIDIPTIAISAYGNTETINFLDAQNWCIAFYGHCICAHLRIILLENPMLIRDRALCKQIKDNAGMFIRFDLKMRHIGARLQVFRFFFLAYIDRCITAEHKSLSRQFGHFFAMSKYMN